MNIIGYNINTITNKVVSGKAPFDKLEIKPIEQNFFCKYLEDNTINDFLKIINSNETISLSNLQNIDLTYLTEQQLQLAEKKQDTLPQNYFVYANTYKYKPFQLILQDLIKKTEPFNILNVKKTVNAQAVEPAVEPAVEQAVEQAEEVG